MRLKSKRFSQLQFFSLVLCVLACRSARAAEVELGKYQFRVADGFSVELVAAPPLVKYPICADFDEQGRLYVCESSGSIDWNKPQLLESMHRVQCQSSSFGRAAEQPNIVFMLAVDLG